MKGNATKNRTCNEPEKEEELFWKAFSEGSYHPDWIFEENNEFVNIAKQPMALWKCRNKAEDKIPLEKEKIK